MANGKAVISGHDEGFCKIITDKNKNTILGAAIIGYLAPEIIHSLSIAIDKSLTINDIKDVIFAHPTVSEIIRDSLGG